MQAISIEHWAACDQRVLDALLRVPRDRFLPADCRDAAFEDHPLPIGHGQTISQPSIVACMTGLADVGPGLRVLEVGTGSGYQAAVLSELGARVFTLEIIPELAGQAGSLLHDLGYSNVSVRVGDGYHGWPDEAPFDAIVVTAAAESVPPALTGQLKEGGRLVIPLGRPFGSQELMQYTKRGGRMHARSILPVRFVPFTRAPASREA